MWVSVALRKLMLRGTPLYKIHFTVRFKFEIYTALHQSILAKWQNDWDDTRGNKVREVKPVVHPLRFYRCPTHRQKVVVNRLRVGHTHLTPGHLLRDPCNIPLNVQLHLYERPNRTTKSKRFPWPCIQWNTLWWPWCFKSTVIHWHYTSSNTLHVPF